MSRRRIWEYEEERGGGKRGKLIEEREEGREGEEVRRDGVG